MTIRFELPDTIWASDLAKEPEPDHFWKIPDLFEQGDRCLLTGGEGEGKSTLIRQWGIMAASGIHPFTLEPIPRQMVFLMDLENSREQIKDEINKICESAGIPVPEPPWLRVASWPAGLDLPSSDFEAALSRRLEENIPDLLMGGPLYKMSDLSVADENQAKQVVSAIDRLREKFHFALVMEAHQVNESVAFNTSTKKFVRNRQIRPFGASLWRRWPEFGFCLYTDGTLVHWRTGRRLRDWPAKLRRGDTWLWEVDDRVCIRCGNDLSPKQEMYCSERCGNAARQARFRQQGALQ